jgi:hypothetical protein
MGDEGADLWTQSTELASWSQITPRIQNTASQANTLYWPTTYEDSGPKFRVRGDSDLFPKSSVAVKKEGSYMEPLTVHTSRAKLSKINGNKPNERRKFLNPSQCRDKTI